MASLVCRARLVVSIEVDKGRRLAQGLRNPDGGRRHHGELSSTLESFEYLPQFKLCSWPMMHRSLNDDPPCGNESSAYRSRARSRPTAVTPRSRRNSWTSSAPAPRSWPGWSKGA